MSQVDGVEYLLHEVYGLENKAKSKEGGKSSGEDEVEEGEEGEEGGEGEGEGEGEGSEDEDEDEDLGAECVVCITDVRDTLLLPCKHLCLCAACGKWRNNTLSTVCMNLSSPMLWSRLALLRVICESIHMPDTQFCGIMLWLSVF